MDTTIETTTSLQKGLYEQAEALAQRLNLSQNEVFARAIENFIDNHQSPTPLTERESGGGGRAINQGDIYWVQLENLGEVEAAIPHPYVVIQDNLFNHSRIHTVVACALTSNLRRESNTPGNVLLAIGEGNLPKQSVVEVSKITTIEKSQLGEYIGTLDEGRVNEILAGMRFLQLSFFRR